VQHTTDVELKTGTLFGGLWPQYDDVLFKESVELFEKRWAANGEPGDFFVGKSCLDAGCGGGRYSIAMSKMGAESVVGIDLGEEGLEDARRRASSLVIGNIEFQRASVLALPFDSNRFHFACCSGVLMGTPGVERGLAELHRVLKPGGSLYLLLYGEGGLYWAVNLVMRTFASVLGKAEVDRCIAAAGLRANKRRTILDDLFVPILETYSRERVEFLLRDCGFQDWRYWQAGRFDQESDPATLVAELEIRVRLWEAGALSCSDTGKALIETHLAGLCRSVILAARNLIDQHKAGRLSDQELHHAIIGHGHHRLIATRSGV